MMTLGHSTLPIQAFLEILKQNACTVVVDIRTLPASRHNPQFAQEALSRSLQTAGLRYRWLKALGGLRHPRKDSPNTGWRNSNFRGYADYMQTPEFDAAIAELLAIRPLAQTVLLCAEAVPWRCHRSLVGDALMARDIPVEDIFSQAHADENGNVHYTSHRKPHPLTSFARIQGTRVWYPPQNDLFAELTPPERKIS